ncbi:hypothetical protein AVEN_274943-1 [Araneus ventricosus]|uniref:Uncharacterized protein n=1 Tax=Araneus ventricosus TaxID=182803 RepID=A0A4Y2AWJ9_ARAVE|nr:hypothetical protein AVEN_274943-1 [Araneus ventricosus]
MESIHDAIRRPKIDSNYLPRFELPNTGGILGVCDKNWTLPTGGSPIIPTILQVPFPCTMEMAADKDNGPVTAHILRSYPESHIQRSQTPPSNWLWSMLRKFIDRPDRSI